MDLESYIDALASPAPVPGGGSAATVVVAFGAALIAMVARITLSNSKYAVKASLAEELIAGADALRMEAERTRLADERAFADVIAAMQLPRGDGGQRELRARQLQSALVRAAAVPLQGAELAASVAALAARALELGNRSLTSDIGCAAEFSAAGLASCAYNVRINHRYMDDRLAVERDAAQLARCESETAALVAVVRAAAARAAQREEGNAQPAT